MSENSNTISGLLSLGWLIVVMYLVNRRIAASETGAGMILLRYLVVFVAGSLVIGAVLNLIFLM